MALQAVEADAEVGIPAPTLEAPEDLVGISFAQAADELVVGRCGRRGWRPRGAQKRVPELRGPFEAVSGVGLVRGAVRQVDLARCRSLLGPWRGAGPRRRYFSSARWFKAL